MHQVELPWPCSNEEYERLMTDAVAAARSAGVTRMVFGDLFLADVRAYREEALAGSGIEPVFPLWGRATAELAGRCSTGASGPRSPASTRGSWTRRTPAGHSTATFWRICPTA